MKMIGSLLILIMANNLFAAGTEGHGGDEVGMDFQRAMMTAVAEVHRSQVELFRQVSLSDLEKIAEAAKVVVVDEPLIVFVEGVQQTSVAVNQFEKQRIIVNRARWTAISEPRLKQAIALHELLSLKQLESTGQYPYSGPYLNRFGIAEDAISTGVIALEADQISKEGTTYQTLKCSETAVMIDRQTKVKYVVESDKVEGLVTWQQGGELFDFSFGGVEPNITSPRNYMMTTRSIEKKDSLGRVVQIKGQRKLQTAVDGKLSVLEAPIETNIEYINEEESISTSIVEGIPSSTRVTRRKLEDGQQLDVQQMKGFEGVMIVESHVKTCVAKRRTFEEIKAFYRPEMVAAIEVFEKQIADVNVAVKVESKDLESLKQKRDNTWKNLVDGKMLLPKKKPTPPAKGKSGRGSRGSSSDRVTPGARDQIDETLRYLREYSERKDREQLEERVRQYESERRSNYRDHYGRPVYQDSFRGFRTEYGMPVDARNVRDQYGSVCTGHYYRQCR